MCICDSKCAVVLGAGAETLCSEHVLMDTVVQYCGNPLFFVVVLLHTHRHTQGANFMQAQPSVQRERDRQTLLEKALSLVTVTANHSSSSYIPCKQHSSACQWKLGSEVHCHTGEEIYCTS